MKTKICTKCGEEKPHTVDFFYKDANRLKAHCKCCADKASKNWGKANKEKLQAISRKAAKKYRDRNIKTCQEASRTWKKKNQHLVKCYAKSYNKKITDELPCCVVVNRLVHRTGFSKEQITPELIGAHRNVIKIKRAIKEMT